MSNVQDMVRAFHEKYQLPLGRTDLQTNATRARMLVEEAGEARDELLAAAVDRVALAKELADTVYVAYGAAVEHDIPLDAIVQLVHRSNMTKNGGVLNGKLTKGPGYEPAEPWIAGLLKGYGHGA